MSRPPRHLPRAATGVRHPSRRHAGAHAGCEGHDAMSPIPDAFIDDRAAMERSGDTGRRAAARAFIRAAGSPSP